MTGTQSIKQDRPDHSRSQTRDADQVAAKALTEGGAGEDESDGADGEAKPESSPGFVLPLSVAADIGTDSGPENGQTEDGVDSSGEALGASHRLNRIGALEDPPHNDQG